jgi:hypothetical protein
MFVISLERVYHIRLDTSTNLFYNVGMDIKDEAFMRALIYVKCRAEGSQAKWARKVGVTPKYVADLLHERRPISKDVANKLGYRRVVRFEEITDDNP